MPTAFAPGDGCGSEAVVPHHSLCFGCGLANLFGLQAELVRAGDRAVQGRFFVKQDHQGASGQLHEGLLGAALQEAMALAIHAEGWHATVSRLELSVDQTAPVGSFVGVCARVSDTETAGIRVDARAYIDGADKSQAQTIARGNGLFVELDSSG